MFYTHVMIGSAPAWARGASTNLVNQGDLNHLIPATQTHRKPYAGARVALRAPREVCTHGKWKETRAWRPRRARAADISRRERLSVH